MWPWDRLQVKQAVVFPFVVLFEKAPSAGAADWASLPLISLAGSLYPKPQNASPNGQSSGRAKPQTTACYSVRTRIAGKPDIQPWRAAAAKTRSARTPLCAVSLRIGCLSCC